MSLRVRLMSVGVALCAARAAQAAPLLASEGAPAPLLSLDPFHAVWTIVLFLALLVVLRARAWEPILVALRERESFIHDALEGARGERHEADALLKRYTAEMDAARVQATALVDAARRDAETARRGVLDGAQREAGEDLAAARREVEAAAADALKRLRAQTGDLAAEMSRRVLGEVRI
ncbi:MAG: ATP synthase subunit b [Phycisphaerae bacterium]|nr:ATP synthase subunit b [Phycisphaerae bacterium]